MTVTVCAPTRGEASLASVALFEGGTVSTATSMNDERLPWGTTSTGELSRTGTLTGSVLGTLAILFFFPLGVAGILLSCKGLDLIRTDLPAARTYMTASWACFVAAPVVTVGILTLFGQ